MASIFLADALASVDGLEEAAVDDFVSPGVGVLGGVVVGVVVGAVNQESG